MYTLRLKALGVEVLRNSLAQCSSEGRYSCSSCFISCWVTPKLYLKTDKKKRFNPLIKTTLLLLIIIVAVVVNFYLIL